MSIKSCAGYYDGVNSKECLQCSICHQWTELLCANTRETVFKSMSIKHKSTWKCPSCVSKQAKDDSTNTPASQTRPAPEPSPRSLPPPRTNVTVPAKSNNSQSHTPAQVNDDALIQFSRGTLREMIKQEIQSALKDSASVQFDLVADFNDSLSFYKKKYEEMKAMQEDTADRIHKLEKDNCGLRDTIEQLSKRLSLLEQNSRSTNVGLQCIPENEAENEVPTVLQPDKTQLSGYLLRKFKKSPGWQKLWVVFAVSTLFFYKSWQDETPLASLPLLGYSVGAPAPDDNIDKDFVFKLQFKNHVYFFRADSQYTFNRWTEVLQTATMRPENE